MKIPTMKTPRLMLRAWSEADIGPLFQMLNDGDIMKYFPNPNPPPREKVEKIIARQMHDWEEHGYAWWAVELPETKTLMGWCGLGYLPETRETEVAYLLGRAHWGHGYATEAARVSLHFGYEQLGIEQIIALVHPENMASTHVIEKLGMWYVDVVYYWGIDLKRYRLGKQQWTEQAPESG